MQEQKKNETNYTFFHLHKLLVSFDAMGMTDNENPIGLVPFLNPGFGIGAFGKRRKRSTTDPDILADKIAGGERYVVAELSLG